VPNTGAELRPLHSGRGDVEFASVFASVATLAVSFVSECIFKPRHEQKHKWHMHLEHAYINDIRVRRGMLINNGSACQLKISCGAPKSYFPAPGS